MKYNTERQLKEIRASKNNREIRIILEGIYADGFDDGECSQMENKK